MRKFGVFVFLICLSSGLMIAADDDDEPAIQYTETIEVSAKKPDDTSLINELPAFVTTIEIDPETPRFQTLPELLNGTVGVSIKDFGGLGSLSTISIRGSAANQVIVLLDGVMINTASDSGVDLSMLPMDNIEKVEVLRGADSAVFGSGAMGGVVNLVTRKSEKKGIRSQASLSYGSFNTADVNAGIWVNRKNHRFRFTTAWQHSDGDYEFVNNNGTEFNTSDDFNDVRVNNDIDAISGSFWFKSEISHDLEFSGSLDGFYDEKGIPGLITFPSPNATQKDRRISGMLKFEKNWSGETAYRLFTELNGKYIGLDFDDPLGEQTGVPVSTRQRTQQLGGRIGTDAYFEKGNAGISFMFNSEQLDDDDFGEPERETLAATIRTDLGFYDDSLWVTGLCRYDDISEVGDHWSPKLGVRWFITPAVSLKANIGAGFRAPSFNELYMQAGFIVGNPDLLPEEALSYDVGVAYEAPKWRIETAVFQIDSEDLIQYLLVSGFRYKPFNIGKARSRGIEFDSSCKLGYGFTLSGSYTYNESIDNTGEPNIDGKQIPGRPEHDGFAKIEWQNDVLNTWTEWHYLSGNFVTRANTKEFPDRSTANVGLTWKMTDFMQIGVEIKNLSDDEVVDVRGFPLPPRSFFGTLKFHL